MSEQDFFHGETAKVEVGGEEICIKSASVTTAIETRSAKTTCTSTGGFTKDFASDRSAEWSITLYMGGESGDSEGGLGEEGDVIHLAIFSHKDNSSPTYCLPTALITSVSLPIEVDNLIEITYGGTNNGPFSRGTSCSLGS